MGAENEERRRFPARLALALGLSVKILHWQPDGVGAGDTTSRDSRCAPGAGAARGLEGSEGKGDEDKMHSDLLDCFG